MRFLSPSSRVGAWIAVVLSVANFVVANENWFGMPPRDLGAIDPSKKGVDFDIVVPHRLDDHGNNDDNSKCYIFNAFSDPYHFCVRPNVDLLPPEFVVLTAEKDGYPTVNFKPRKCYYRGTLMGQRSSEVAISVCNGMSGLIRTSTTEVFIQPLPKRYYRKFGLGTDGGDYHVIYRRFQSENDVELASGSAAVAAPSPLSTRFCDVTDNVAADVEMTKKGGKKRRAATPKPPASSLDGSGYRAHIELMVVADHRMMKRMESPKEAEEYILTLMNIVDSLFTDDDLGLGIKISVVRLKMLGAKDGFDLGEKESPGDALRQFQQWQRKYNAPNGHSDHFDAAVLLTGTNLCTDNDCNTIGKADIGSMCNESRSAVLAHDSGLLTAFIVAHELGHALGMWHDGKKNGCSENDGLIMSPQLGGSPNSFRSQNMFRWSTCSRAYLDKFLRSDDSYCLSNWPDKESLLHHRAQQPGEIYSVEQQCRLFEPNSPGPCHPLYTGSVCSNLGCWTDSQKHTCIAQKAPAADGTPCDPDRRKICWKGHCIPRPEPVHGKWSLFYDVGECSQTCGGGIIRRRRYCSSPPYGGLHCVGSNVQYAVCNTQPCPNGLSSRAGQCAQLDNVFQLSATFEPFIRESGKECNLVCKNRQTGEIHDLPRSVADGTPCTTNDTYRCMSGTCRVIGCDGVVDSTKVFDKCGVCGGDGSSCKTVSKKFDKPQLKDGFNTLFKLKISAMNIRIEDEEASLATHLMLKKADHEILIDGRRDAVQTVTYAGLQIRYNRSDDGREQIVTDGKLNETMTFGVVYDSSRGASSTITLSFVRAKLSVLVGEVEWNISRWGSCSQTCNKEGSEAVQRRSVICYSRTLRRVVSNKYCETLLTREMPKRYRSCQGLPKCANVQWIADPWTACDSSCKKSRVVGCYEMVPGQTLKEVPGEKCGDGKPPATMLCSAEECSLGSCRDLRTSCTILSQVPMMASECKTNEAVSGLCCATCNALFSGSLSTGDSSGTDDSD